jgi:hypothetical protein
MTDTDADVIQLRPSDVIPRERFEHALDDDQDDPQPVHQPGGFKLPKPKDDRRPVVPAALQSREALRKEAAARAEQLSYELRFHAIRLPWYAVKTIAYALWGTLVTIERLRRWWWVSEATGARLVAAVENDGREYRTHHQHQRKVRGERGMVIGACALAACVAGIALNVVFPWGWAAVAPVLALFAARAGQPEGRPIITPSMTEPVIRVISEDTLVRAYAAAGLCKPGTDGQELRLGVMARDRYNAGTQAPVFLPHGKTFADVVNAKAKIASGLDVKISQVYFTEDDTSERRHTVWIADEDPLAIPAGRTPLLNLKRRNVWRDLFEMGLDQFGRKVAYSLLWVSFMIGAQPRKGKTFTARQLALFCALDPYVRITVVDGKASPDWRTFKLVAHRAIFGTRPDRDGDPVGRLRAELAAIEKHIADTNDFLSTLDTTECPEGKLTEELCRKYPKKLFVWLLVMDEFQFYFELDDQDANKEIAQALANIRAAGPSAGVILESSTQKPAGVGSGSEVQRLFNRYRDNHDVRIALKCGNRDVSQAVLGGDAYSQGWDASALPNGKRFRGVCIFHDHPDIDETLTVRNYLADGEDADVIITAGRKFREQAGTLSGDAADEELSVLERDVLADVLSVLGPVEPGQHWTVIADRLAEQIPERWADVTAAAITAQCRDLHVPSVTVKVGGDAQRGCRRAHLEAARRGDLVAAE